MRIPNADSGPDRPLSCICAVTAVTLVCCLGWAECCSGSSAQKANRPVLLRGDGNAGRCYAAYRPGENRDADVGEGAPTAQDW